MISDNSMDEIDAEANEILKSELNGLWYDQSYEQIRKNPDFYGFTAKYLSPSANPKELSSSANISTLLKLAKLDLQKRTTIAELVFSCCVWFPNKKAIESLIDLGKQSETEEKVIRSIFQFEDNDGNTCLTVIFNLAILYRRKNNKKPSGPMLSDIEDSCLFLIQLAKSVNLGLDKI